jgi:hypothetical protein
MNAQISLVAHQSILAAIQSVIRAMLGLESIVVQAKRSRTRAAARARDAYEDLAARGDRLLDALRLERELTANLPAESSGITEGDMAQWTECRRGVEQLVEQYLISIAAWREEVESKCQHTIRHSRKD